MSIDSLTEVVAILFAISLASERFVTSLKSMFPKWLEDEKKTEAQEVDLVADRNRRVAVQLISFFAAWFAAGFMAQGTAELPVDSSHAHLHLFGNVFFASSKVKIPAFIVGLLGSGGSSFWNNILGYTKAVKDIQIQERAKKGLEYHMEAAKAGVVAVDGGKAVVTVPKTDLIEKAKSISVPTI